MYVLNKKLVSCLSIKRNFNLCKNLQRLLNFRDCGVFYKGIVDYL